VGRLVGIAFVVAVNATNIDTSVSAATMTAMNQLIAILKANIDGRAVNVSHLAGKLGCSRQHLYNVAAGKCKPNFEFSERLADELGLAIKLTVRKKTTESKIRV